MEEKNYSLLAESDYLEILADAISDVGYWSWWAEKLPDVFQIEFGGSQLFFPPINPESPPQSKIAIQFRQPISVSFISRNENPDNFVWSQQLHNDEIEPPTCTHGDFTFTDIELMKALLEKATRIKTIYGYEPKSGAFSEEPYHLIFWCGDVGMAVASKEIRLLSREGEVAVTDIAEINQKWWEYWRMYWDKKDTSDELPKDYACEVTIPLKS